MVVINILINSEEISLKHKKVTWHETDTDEFDIYIDDDLSGRIFRSINFKWKFKVYFKVESRDKHYLNKQYNQASEAKNKLVELWEKHISNLDSFDKEQEKTDPQLDFSWFQNYLNNIP